MGKKHSQASKLIQSSPTSRQEIDYSPKTYTLRAQLVFGVKFLLIAGIIMLLFVLIGKNIQSSQARTIDRQSTDIFSMYFLRRWAMNDTLREVEKVDRYDPGEPVKLQTSHYLGKNSQPDLNIEMCKA